MEHRPQRHPRFARLASTVRPFAFAPLQSCPSRIVRAAGWPSPPPILSPAAATRRFPLVDLFHHQRRRLAAFHRLHQIRQRLVILAFSFSSTAIRADSSPPVGSGIASARSISDRMPQEMFFKFVVVDGCPTADAAPASRLCRLLSAVPDKADQPWRNRWIDRRSSFPCSSGKISWEIGVVSVIQKSGKQVVGVSIAARH